ncbi:hypothetical protein IJG89_04185 [Candidatus Saccharibacteria bacterium]|nr:hypothetical protein [Candidatus Saccharibacteria bacterium]
MKPRYQVIVKTLPKDAPYDFEMSAALIIANHFKTNIVFLRPGHMKSPDLLIKNEIWELKSPRGNSKNTIHNIFVTSRKQSYNVIIDLRRCRMNEQNAFARIRDAFNKRRRKKCQLLVITKHGKVIDISELL